MLVVLWTASGRNATKNWISLYLKAMEVDIEEMEKKGSKMKVAQVHAKRLTQTLKCTWTQLQPK